MAWLIQGAVMFMKNPKAVNDQLQCREDDKVMYVQQNNYMRLFEKSEKTPTQAELSEKLRELTGEKRPEMSWAIQAKEPLDFGMSR